MSNLILNIFGILSAATIVSGLILARGAFYKEQPGAKYLSAVCIFVALVDVFYFISILPLSYVLVSFFSTLYFISIDLMLYCLLEYVYLFTGHSKAEKVMRLPLRILKVWIAADSLVLLVNVRCEIALTYISRHTPFAEYRYGRFFLYNCHLALSYVMVVMVAVLLVHKLLVVPREYQRQYLIVIGGILLIVLINAAFLFIPDDNLWTLIDWSILGYSIAAYILYWTSFQYATHGMLNRFKTVIFENIEQGLILFDYTDHLILANAKARKLVPGLDYGRWLPMQDLLDKLGLVLEAGSRDREISLQCEVDRKFLRCDFSTIRNDHHQMIGHLFILTNASLETDLLTGFQNKENFVLMARENPEHFPVPSAVVMFDLNNLGAINSRHGKEEGDRRIRRLAEMMRSAFPKESYYVRGDDARLIVITYHETEQSIRSYIGEMMQEGIPADYSARGQLTGVEYALAQTSPAQPDIVTAVENASVALRNKKLLNDRSSHAELLTSLEQALEQCDPDTRAHVERTRQLGALLGGVIGLSDLEQSQLSLLCLLHDIGKIGIPLEILNKPGKLDADEWKIMQSHVEKGYEIAKSSKEIAGIADMILHHHERWDGKGYPDGLREEKIPLLSRMIGVVDAFDAMVNDRVYRKAMSVPEALRELERCAGTQFDPDLVAAFVKVVKENSLAGKLIQKKSPSGKTVLSAVFGPDQRTEQA